MWAFQRYSLRTQPRQDVTTSKLHPIITDAVIEFSRISYGTYVEFDSWDFFLTSFDQIPGPSTRNSHRSFSHSHISKVLIWSRGLNSIGLLAKKATKNGNTMSLLPGSNQGPSGFKFTITATFILVYNSIKYSRLHIPGRSSSWAKKGFLNI